MRTFATLLVVLFCAQASAQQQAPANPPAPGPAVEEPVTQAPVTPQQQRNWLLARLIVDQNFDNQKVQGIQQKLAEMSADQLDVLVRVYQQSRHRQETAEQSQLDQAQANLDQMKAYRNVLSQDLDNLRAFRQAQYLNFGQFPYGYGRSGYGGLGYGRLGYGRLGYGGYGYGGYGGYVYGGGAYPVNVATPVPGYPYPAYGFRGAIGMGYSGMGYSGMGYGGPGYGAVGPGYGGGYPINGGGYFPGAGASY